MGLYKINNFIIKANSIDDVIDKTKFFDISYKYLSEKAKKLKEELKLYNSRPGSHQSKGIKPKKQRKVDSQTKEYNECINEAVKTLSEGELTPRAWNRLSIKKDAWKNDSEHYYLYKKAENAIKKFEKFISENKKEVK